MKSQNAVSGELFRLNDLETVLMHKFRVCDPYHQGLILLFVGTACAACISALPENVIPLIPQK